MPTPTDPTRPRGILNERERRYLLGQSDIDPKSQPERDIRATIRERLTHAVYDLALLFDTLDDRDLDQVFDPRGEAVAAFRTALEDALGFLYRATVDFHPPFPYLAREAIQRAEQTHFDRHVRATIDIEATAPVDLDALKAKMDEHRGQGLTPEEARWIAETIVEAEDVSFSDLDAAHERLRAQHAGLEATQPEPDDESGGDTA